MRWTGRALEYFFPNFADTLLYGFCLFTVLKGKGIDVVFLNLLNENDITRHL